MNFFKSFRFWLGIAFIIAFFAIRHSGIADSITIARLQEKRHLLATFVENYYYWAVCTFIGSYAGLVLLGLPLAALWTLFGGFLFGTFLGAVYSVIGATIGATFFFLIIRHSLGSALQKKYSRQLERFNAQMHRYGVSYLIAVRFIFVIPFFVLNLLIGLTNTSLWRFVWTTVVGIFPGSLVYAYAGKQITTIERMQDLFTPNILMALILLMLMALIPILAQRYGMRINGSRD